MSRDQPDRATEDDDDSGPKHPPRRPTRSMDPSSGTDEKSRSSDLRDWTAVDAPSTAARVQDFYRRLQMHHISSSSED